MAGTAPKAAAGRRKAGLLGFQVAGAAIVILVITALVGCGDETPKVGTPRAIEEKLVPAEPGPPEERPRAADEASLAAMPPEEAADVLRAEALRMVDRLIRDLPDRHEPVALLALAHSRFGNTAEAVKCWQRCLELDPDAAGAYDGMGRIALHNGEFEEAAAHFRKALAMTARLPEVRPLLADVLMNLGKPDEAVAVLEEDLELFPQRAQSLLQLGRAHLQLGRYEEAAKSLRAAVRIDPGLTEAYYSLAGVSARLGQAGEARKYRETFAHLKADNQEVTDGRRLAIYQPERVRKAAAALHLAAGNLYARNGMSAQAEQRWRRAATLDAEDVSSRHQLTLGYLQSGRTQEALEALGQLRTIEPENPVHCLNLGVVYARLERFEEAEDAFQTTRRLAPGNPAGHAALAQLYLQTGRNLSEARTAAQSAVQLEPTAANYFLLSAACDRSGDVAGALAAIEKAVELHPDNAQYAQMHERLRQKK